MVFMIISCNESDFRTGTYSDTTAPDEVILFNLDAAGTNKIAITYNNPKQTDLRGILLVRWTNEISWTPVKNTPYSNGQDLGDGLTVISTNKLTYNDRENALIDTGLIETYTYHYKVFTYDTRTNYSDGVSANANPGPYAVGWIGGGVNGWQTGDGSTTGNALGWINGPLGVVVDNEGNIYVAEYYNNRVSKWDKNGKAVGWIGCGLTGWQQGNQTNSGSGLSYFYRPYGLYIAPSGNIYIADNGNARICKWDKNGNALGWIGGGVDGWQTGNGATPGNQYNYFANPQGIYLDSSWNILVADTGLNRIAKWNNNTGSAMGWIGGATNGWKTGTGAVAEQDYKSFYYPSDVGIDVNGNIYVADEYNNRISKWYNSAGTAQGWIGWTATNWRFTDVPAITGAGGGSINNPKSVYLIGSKYIYSTEIGSKRIVRWNQDGTGFLWFGAGSNGWNYGDTLSGNDFKSFRSPWFITLDTNGNIYISDHVNQRVCKWRLY